MKTVRITEAESAVLAAAYAYAETQSGEACRDLLQAAMRLQVKPEAPAGVRSAIRERPAPFVCVLVEATIDLDGEPKKLTTMGTAGYVKNRNEKPLRLSPQVPLKDGRITVFCDLERVAVRGIQVGPHLFQSAFGECPVAHFDKLSIAEVISVMAEAADESTRAR